ncbi:chaplin [Streptomyces sp. SP17BM10]|uniref:chaplin n=1 Tax=Streptomyces sp. SP17BM10 TaxID=3002530 RepID=UPI002E7A8B5B|nr:chaplin [Streptomyces sp. SP17BM10]MEE1782069.1 chaplin [Streptomyces sp. SP17BM10]
MRIRTALAATGLAAMCVVAGAGTAAAGDATANGVAFGSPGVLSGNQIQIPVNIEANVCGNSIGVISILNPAFGNTCINA